MAAALRPRSTLMPPFRAPSFSTRTLIEMTKAITVTLLGPKRPPPDPRLAAVKDVQRDASATLEFKMVPGTFCASVCVCVSTKKNQRNSAGGPPAFLDSFKCQNLFLFFTMFIKITKTHIIKMQNGAELMAPLPAWLRSASKQSHKVSSHLPATFLF